MSNKSDKPLSNDNIEAFQADKDEINLTNIGIIGIGDDGKKTEVGEIRLSYDSSLERTFVPLDALEFKAFIEDRNYTLIPTSEKLSNHSNKEILTESSEVDSFDLSKTSEGVHVYSSDGTYLGKSKHSDEELEKEKYLHKLEVIPSKLHELDKDILKARQNTVRLGVETRSMLDDLRKQLG